MRELCPGTPRFGDSPEPPDSRLWFALAVMPQHEIVVQQGLSSKGLRAYAPVYWTARRWSDRVKRLQLPLFPGYVFCNVEPGDRAAAVKTWGVRRMVSFGNVPAPIPDQQIAAIQQMLASKYPVEPWPFMRPGQRVRIGEGSLAGLEGVLDQTRSSVRVVINVDLLQRSVAVELNPASLIPLD